MTKTRACELLATSIMAVPNVPLAPKRLIYSIKPSEIIGGNAPTGSSTWGPWRVEIPDALIKHRAQIQSLEIIGLHRCHALWLQETHYGHIPVEKLPS